MYNTLVCPDSALLEEITQRIFELLPDQGLVLGILGPDGACEASDTEVFARVFSDEQLLGNICDRIDDGDEPVVSQIGNCGIVAAQLTAGAKRYGYVVIVLPEHSPEMTFANIALIETVLNQASLIAELIQTSQTNIQTPAAAHTYNSLLN